MPIRKKSGNLFNDPRTNIDINNEYTVIVRNKFDILLEISENHSANEEYQSFITAHMECATKC